MIKIMSQFYEYNWPATTGNEIALSQTTIANIPLLLNGSYVNQTTGAVNFVTDFGIVPRITLNSAANLSAINFLITGYQNGVFISETLTGPNSIPVTSVNCFDSVVQIIPTGTTGSTIQVGVASVGYFPIILLNNMKQNSFFLGGTLNIVAASASPATYQVFLSLKNNLGSGKYDDLITSGDFAAPNGNATASALTPFVMVARNLLIKIGQNNNNSTLKCQFLQF